MLKSKEIFSHFKKSFFSGKVSFITTSLKQIAAEGKLEKSEKVIAPFTFTSVANCLLSSLTAKLLSLLPKKSVMHISTSPNTNKVIPNPAAMRKRIFFTGKCIFKKLKSRVEEK